MPVGERLVLWNVRLLERAVAGRALAPAELTAGPLVPADELRQAVR